MTNYTFLKTCFYTRTVTEEQPYLDKQTLFATDVHESVFLPHILDAANCNHSPLLEATTVMKQFD